MSCIVCFVSLYTCILGIVLGRILNDVITVQGGIGGPGSLAPVNYMFLTRITRGTCNTRLFEFPVAYHNISNFVAVSCFEVN